MGQLIVITTPDLATGFELAGVETFAVETVAAAAAILTDLMRGEAASLILIRQDFLSALGSHLRREIERRSQPLVIGIPGAGPTALGQERRRQIDELIRRAIGFHITFGGEEPQDLER